MTDESTEPGLMDTEPAVSIGVGMTAIAQAIFALLRATGVEATKDLEESTVALITALLMAPALSGFLTRFWVWPKTAVIEAEEEAYDEGYLNALVSPAQEV